MAAAILYCTCVLLLYLQGSNAQQGLSNNQNVGVNNAIGFQQQALQRTNGPNNINQMPNGGFNINLPQQSNLQQGNLQQAISGNLQGKMPQSLTLPTNLNSQGGSLGNIQVNKQGFMQLPPGFTINPSNPQPVLPQMNNGAKQNAQNIQQQNVGPIGTVRPLQTQNAPCLSNSLAEIAALKGYPSLLSLFASQNNFQPQQNQQTSETNFNPPQNQLTDAQKQFLVKAIQSQLSGQNQQGLNYGQSQSRHNRPSITSQGNALPSQQPQAIVTPLVSQPPYITVQAQPLTTYLQNQPQQIEEPSILSLILSEFQPSDSQYVYPSYPVQKKESSSNLKTLIPLIINLLKEKNNNCGCQNCGCPNNGCGNNNIMPPAVFTGYSNQKNYGQGTEETSIKPSVVEEEKSKGKETDRKNVKKNVVNVDSEEASNESDSEYIDDSEGD